MPKPDRPWRIEARHVFRTSGGGRLKCQGCGAPFEARCSYCGRVNIDKPEPTSRPGSGTRYG